MISWGGSYEPPLVTGLSFTPNLDMTWIHLLPSIRIKGIFEIFPFNSHLPANPQNREPNRYLISIILQPLRARTGDCIATLVTPRCARARDIAVHATLVVQEPLQEHGTADLWWVFMPSLIIARDAYFSVCDGNHNLLVHKYKLYQEIRIELN